MEFRMNGRSLCLLAAFLAAHQAHAADSDLRSCRALADKDARLACYDALPLAAEVRTTPAAPAPAPTPAPAAASTSAASAGGLADWFGFSADRRQQPAQPEAIETSIVGRFEGWRPKQLITLANGQVWRISDDSSAFYELQSPRVTVRRGVLGAYYLEVEGVNQSPRVRRER